MLSQSPSDKPSAATPSADPVTVELVAFNEGGTASVRVTLNNASPQTVGQAELRAPVPAGMSLLESTPAAEEHGAEVGWRVVALPPGEGVSFSYRLNTHGLAAEAQATATVGSVTYTRALFPIGSPATPPKIGPIPAVAAVPPGRRRAARPPSAVTAPSWQRVLVTFLVGGLVATAARRLLRGRRTPTAKT